MLSRRLSLSEGSVVNTQEVYHDPFDSSTDSQREKNSRKLFQNISRPLKFTYICIYISITPNFNIESLESGILNSNFLNVDSFKLV